MHQQLPACLAGEMLHWLYLNCFHLALLIISHRQLSSGQDNFVGGAPPRELHRWNRFSKFVGDIILLFIHSQASTAIWIVLRKIRRMDWYFTILSFLGDLSWSTLGQGSQQLRLPVDGLRNLLLPLLLHLLQDRVPPEKRQQGPGTKIRIEIQKFS